MKLGNVALKSGHELITYDSIGSTNAAALELVSQGFASQNKNQNPVWIISARQTEGKGRQGREWSSPPGNFYGSLLLSNPCDMRHAAQLGFVAGVALISALQKIVPSLQGLTLKWPNDALLKGSKIAGILLEASQTNTLSVVIGIGINLAFHPDNTPYRATNLATHGAPISVADCLKALSNAFTEKLVLFERGANFTVIRDEWLKCAYEIGTPIKVNTQNGKIDGVFGGIDEFGSLILKQSDINQTGKEQLISAGDVYFDY
jgi:BirA family transcriptional regulator, biotin operon repressor / biotin---[acetyl-CoA-carboxylase] ligase